jgi:hypothetical protein
MYETISAVLDVVTQALAAKVQNAVLTSEGYVHAYVPNP